MQIGPIQLALSGIQARAARLLNVPLQLTQSVVAALLFVLGLVLVARLLVRDQGRSLAPGLELFIGLVACLGGLSWAASTSGHPTEGFIPLLWVLAARDIKRSRHERAGVLIALSAGLKMWGAMGAPLLMLNPDFRKVVRGWVVQIGTIAVLYGPFFVFGKVNTFSFHWFVRPQSPLTFFLAPDSPFTWEMRIAESVFVALAGVALALALRRSSAAVWAVPLAVVAAKFLVDPLDYHYYWLSVGTLALLGAATLMTPEPSWIRLPIGAGFYATLIPWFLLVGTTAALYIIAISSAAAFAAVLVARRHVEAAPAGDVVASGRALDPAAVHEPIVT